MGRTARTFRDAIRVEEAKWRNFRRTLRPGERELLDWVFNAARRHGDAGTVVVNPRTIEIVLLMAVIELQREIESLRQGPVRTGTQKELCQL